jgi:hypothetical protein
MLRNPSRKLILLEGMVGRCWLRVAVKPTSEIADPPLEERKRGKAAGTEDSEAEYLEKPSCYFLKKRLCAYDNDLDCDVRAHTYATIEIYLASRFTATKVYTLAPDGTT